MATTAFQRLKKSLRELGWGATLFKFYVLAVDHLFDLRHGTDTNSASPPSGLTIRSDNQDRAEAYAAARIVPLRRCLERIKPLIPDDAVFVDFGCGKGRALLLASEVGFRKATGVEFAQELCGIAKANCDVYKRQIRCRTDFQVVESDAAEYVVGAEENVFFMFNPFDDVVLSRVLDNIATSLEDVPRPALIIYFNPVHGDLIERHGIFSKLIEGGVAGYDFAAYSTNGASAIPHGVG